MKGTIVMFGSLLYGGLEIGSKPPLWTKLSHSPPNIFRFLLNLCLTSLLTGLADHYLNLRLKFC
jgi:hypothetical protein